MCPLEKIFWKCAANLQENTHAEVWFQQSCFATLLRSHLGIFFFLQTCCIISDHLFKRTNLEGCFWIRRKRYSAAMECLHLTVSYYIFMNNYFTTFRLFNNIRATGALNKNRWRTCTIAGDKQSQKNPRNMATLNNAHQAKKAVLI